MIWPLGGLPLLPQEAIFSRFKRSENRLAGQTGDLAGFWTTHYPKIRQELGRKHPRHYWPEDPRTAAPILHKARVP